MTVEQGSQDAEVNRLKNNNVDVVVDIPRGFGAALSRPGSPRSQVVPYQGSQTSTTASIADQILGQVLDGFASKGAPRVSLASTPDGVGQPADRHRLLPARDDRLHHPAERHQLRGHRAGRPACAQGAAPVPRDTGDPAQILGSQIAGGALTVALQLLVLILVGLVFFQAHMYGSWLVAAVPMVLGIGAFVGIGFLLTTAARTSEAARGLATLVAFPMMFLSGMFFPITTLPGWLQTVVHVLPLTWLTDALHRVMNDGAGLTEIALDLLVLAGWAVVTFAIATWRFRWD